MLNFSDEEMMIWHAVSMALFSVMAGWESYKGFHPYKEKRKKWKQDEHSEKKRNTDVDKFIEDPFEGSPDNAIYSVDARAIVTAILWFGIVGYHFVRLFSKML